MACRSSCSSYYRHKLNTIHSESLIFSFCLQILAMVSLGVIVLSVSTFCVETMLFFKRYRDVFRGLEYLYCVWFTVEFVARFFACPDKIEYFKSFMTWVDLLSVIPLYISLTNQVEELDFLFVLRLVRIFRLFRFFRTMSGMQVIGHTLRASARELFLLILILCIPMVIFSTLLYYAEKWVSRVPFCISYYALSNHKREIVQF